jgi:hypothetical protein
LNDAKIAEIQAKVFKLYEEGKGVTEKQRIDAFRASMELLREENKSLDSQIKSLMEIGRNELQTRSSGLGTVPGVAPAPSDQSGALAPTGLGSPQTGGLV